MLFPNLLDRLVQLWAVHNSLEEIRKKPVDLVVPISYSILPTRLTDATRLNLFAAANFRENMFPGTPIALSNCAYTFPGAAAKERRLREEMLLKRGVLLNVIWADNMNNSIQEARMIRKAVEEKRFSPKCILVVTCLMHTRSAKHIWQQTFPAAEILVYANDWTHEAEPGQPVLIQRSHWLWFFGNIARQVLIRLKGLDYVSQMRHRSQVRANNP